ncbi:MAG: hypothetical protein PQJ61_10365 [Spirochaetales bacterium]|uniref:Uncharacterized protein n=1 Tax=Candidatus Thalassospirochaeta sargassi TaxID=3119039 RepID=A0AAJ1ID75_9SPIO|nr:hypothetical protein [Spirochaetales bacterium]
MSYCYSCGKEFPGDIKVFRSTECPFCGRDVRVCLNCEFYSPGSNYDCREHVSEAVIEKDKANFCDYFRLGANKSSGSVKRRAEEARSNFNNLFGDE